jgi:outer membrane protein insertion porin family
MLTKHSEESFIKVGRPYQYQDFLNEQERIITLLSNNGYFEFDEQYVCFKAEVSQDDHTIAITTIVDGADSRVDHYKTKIGAVIVDLTGQREPPSSDTSLQTKECQGIRFFCRTDQYRLGHLVRKITIRPGDFYNKSEILETHDRLHRMAIFESITILPKLEAGQLNIYIHAKPYERLKLQIELGGECINLNLKRLRPTFKLTPTIRGFGGLGTLRMEVNIALMEQLVTKERYKFYEHLVYGLRGKFTTPYFIPYFPEKTNLGLENFRPSTTIDIGYSFRTNPIHSRKK